MARKRMIDPIIWEDENFGKLSPNGRLLFIGLFSNADDEGRIRANPSYIRSTIFMYDDIPLESISELLLEVVSTMKSVSLYHVGENDFIQLTKWDKYQKQRMERVQKSVLPSMSDTCQTDDGQMSAKCPHKLSKVKLSKDIIAKKSQSSQKNEISEKKDPYKRLGVEQQHLVHKLGYFLEDTLNTKIVNWGKQAKAVASMERAGYTEVQIKHVINEMWKEDYWRELGFDLMDVANQIPKYKAKRR